VKKATSVILRSDDVECLRIVYTDLDTSWLLARFGEVESVGPSTKKMERAALSNSTVFLALSWRGIRCQPPNHPGSPRLAKSQEIVTRFGHLEVDKDGREKIFRGEPERAKPLLVGQDLAITMG
jgi:hypothetical protein